MFERRRLRPHSGDVPSSETSAGDAGSGLKGLLGDATAAATAAAAAAAAATETADEGEVFVFLHVLSASSDSVSVLSFSWSFKLSVSLSSTCSSALLTLLLLALLLLALLVTLPSEPALRDDGCVLLRHLSSEPAGRLSAVAEAVALVVLLLLTWLRGEWDDDDDGAVDVLRLLQESVRTGMSTRQPRAPARGERLLVVLLRELLLLRLLQLLP